MHDKSNDPSWLFTPEGHSRGYIESDALRELWFHTGTNCNGWIPSGCMVREHEQIRTKLVEPRSHFAVVCAAVGCPTMDIEQFAKQAGTLNRVLLSYSSSRRVEFAFPAAASRPTLRK